MLIKDLLQKDGFNTKGISEKILNLNVNCDTARLSDKYCPTNGIDLIGEYETYLINLEKNEFAPFTKIEFDKDMNISKEISFDEDLNVICVLDESYF